MAVARRGLKDKVIYQVQRSMQNVCATRVFTAAFYEYWLMTAAVGFYYDGISCELARRRVRRGATEASDSSGVKRVWAW